MDSLATKEHIERSTKLPTILQQVMEAAGLSIKWYKIAASTDQRTESAGLSTWQNLTTDQQDQIAHHSSDKQNLS